MSLALVFVKSENVSNQIFYIVWSCLYSVVRQSSLFQAQSNLVNPESIGHRTIKFLAAEKVCCNIVAMDFCSSSGYFAVLTLQVGVISILRFSLYCI